MPHTMATRLDGSGWKSRREEEGREKEAAALPISRMSSGRECVESSKLRSVSGGKSGRTGGVMVTEQGVCVRPACACVRA